MPTSTYPAVKTFSQGSVTVSPRSRTLDVVSFSTATSGRPRLHPPPTEYARVPRSSGRAPQPGSARISSRNATRDAPASRRSIKIAEIMVASVQAQSVSATVAARAERLARRTRALFASVVKDGAIRIALTIAAVCDRSRAAFPLRGACTGGAGT